jgi:hypothetical protein
MSGICARLTVKDKEQLFYKHLELLFPEGLLRIADQFTMEVEKEAQVYEMTHVYTTDVEGCFSFKMPNEAKVEVQMVDVESAETLVSAIRRIQEMQLRKEKITNFASLGLDTPPSVEEPKQVVINNNVTYNNITIQQPV